MFKPATKEKSKLRLALMGPSGSGKTYTALALATNLGQKVAVIDSERGSASKYADLFSFDTCDLDSHSPQTYVNYIKEAEKAGYDVLVIDSLSHAWSGKDGALEQVDKVNKRSQSGNSFTAWREVTPMHNALVDAILQSKCHVISTMRTKQEYVLEENEKGRKVPKKIGMAPIQRDGIEYEMDVIADMNLDHDFIVSKTRCAALDGFVTRKPGAGVAEILRAWLNGGSEPAPKSSAQATATTGNHQDAGAQKSESVGSLSATLTTTKESGHPHTGQPTATVKPTSESATAGDADPKSQTNFAPTPGDSENSQSAAQSASSGTATAISQAEMGALLQTAVANCWDKKQISNFICQTFKVQAATVAKELTRKQYDTAMKLFSRPENAGGKVVVNGEGNALPAEHCWPKA